MKTVCVPVVAAIIAIASFSYVLSAGAEEFSSDLTVATESPAPPAAPDAAPAAAPEKGPPLPFLTIEGVGGGAITPMAYLVNPGDECHTFGKPSAALSVVNAGEKNLDSIAVADTLFQRIEIGYAAERFGVGTLRQNVENATGLDIGTNDVWLHNFDARVLLVKENTCFAGVELPAITAGADIKYNSSIADINNRLLGTLTGIGYRNASGVDYTLTATKTIPEAFGRPVIVTAGLRLSEGADLGFLGFGNTYYATFEGNVACLLTDQLLVAYEFRQKTDPYSQVVVGGNTLIGTESNWNAIDVALILNKHTTFVAGWGAFGVLADTTENGAWFLQLKHEF